MKILIREGGGKKRKLSIPLLKSFAGIAASVMCSNKSKMEEWVDNEDMSAIRAYTEQENLPSKKEVRAFLTKAIEILKRHKGLELVEVEDGKGDYVRITL